MEPTWGQLRIGFHVIRIEINMELICWGSADSQLLLFLHWFCHIIYNSLSEWPHTTRDTLFESPPHSNIFIVLIISWFQVQIFCECMLNSCVLANCINVFVCSFLMSLRNLLSKILAEMDAYTDCRLWFCKLIVEMK